MKLNIDMSETEIPIAQLLPSTTVEDLVEQYNSLKFYDSELAPTNKDLLYLAVDNTELLLELTMESIFVNKMQTIARNISWVAQNEHRPFYSKYYKQRLLDPNTESDKFGNVKGWGMKMTPEEWDVYEQAHDVIFIMEDNVRS